MLARSRNAIWVTVVCVIAVALAGAASASAGTTWWGVTSSSTPSNLPPGGEAEIVATVSNLGYESVTGEEGAVNVTDKLPAGFQATSITGFWPGWGRDRLKAACRLSTLTCTYAPDPHEAEGHEGGPIEPYNELEVEIRVKVEEGAPSGGENEVTVSGGGVPSASARAPLTVNGAPTPFGVEGYALKAENEGGSIDRQAGSHPFQLTSTFALNTINVPRGEEFFAASPEMAKDLSFVLPSGMVGNPTPFPRCTDQEFTAKPGGSNSNGCPADTAVGIAVPDAIEPSFLGLVPFKFVVPVFNLTPAVGEPARFGFTDVGVSVVLDTSVRTGSDYAVVVSAHDIDQSASFLGSSVTIWGVPGDPRHDSARGWKCLGLPGPEQSCVPLGQTDPPPLLTLPTSCNGPLHTSVEGDSWARPGTTVSHEYTFLDETGQPYGLNGCNRLSFDPRIDVTPDGQAASTPTGLTVGVHVPQDAGLAATGLAESTVKDTTVTLPDGLALNPAGADGLLACSETQVGFEGVSGTGSELFSPGLPEPFCPDASKVGTVEIRTPLLPNPLVGAVYLAAQEANPFGSLIAMYLVAKDPVSGVLVKLAGEVAPDERTGQLVSTFKNTPQLPFEDLSLHFFGGSRAPLATPPLCGKYRTTASFAPWSGNPPAEPSSEFGITSGPNGAPCPDPRPFAPDFQAGSTNIQAGAFTPFTNTMTRPDADQPLGALSLTLPAGLMGTLANVTLCGEPQADQGTCPPASLIGHTVVSAGLGSNPVTVKRPGSVFITGPYEGAPFGLSIVNPTEAGPFNLGPVVVRAKIEVDPITAQLRVSTDPTGPYKIPTIFKGIPLQLQHVNVTVDRPDFTFNPTDCDPLKIEATLQSGEGAGAHASTPFQVTNCARLTFKPKFTASTSSKTSRKNGASLSVKLTYPPSAFGAQANVHSVKVDLPKQLPSRLTTLQKACPDSVFASNPSVCPAGSKVGIAKAITPVLPVELHGPVYFVSHGGAKFPELIIVLQGYGVTVDLHGETFISKAGITSSTFRQVPDVPVGSFELNLPSGPDSALAANGSLCARKLLMPTAFTAQNGIVIRRSTRIGVTGCRKVNRTRTARHRKHG